MSIFGEVVPGEGPAPTGFNWGAFLFSGIFLLGYGQFVPFVMWLAAAILLPMFLGGAGSFLAFVVGLGVSIYSGMNGNQIAWASGRYATHQELERSRRRWNIAALAFVGIIVALLIIL